MKDEALRLALEDLEHFEKAGLATLRTIDAIIAIKKVLAQPEPEPRVWIDHRVHAWPDCFVMQPDPPHTSPLYTSPPKREPLTDEEIETYRYMIDWTAGWSYIEFARAIEAAHGIKGEA